MAKVARNVVDVMLGEATHGNRQQRYRDLLGIASVIANRAARTGVPPQSVVGVSREFNAYGKALPKGVEKYRSLAEQAWQQVQTMGPVHNATYYATPAATGNLPSGLQPVDRTTGHVYFDDPLGRAIGTAQGFVRPAIDALRSMLPSTAPTPTARPSVDVGANRPEVSRNLANIGYDLGPSRPNRPSSQITDTIRSAVHDVLGPGYSVTVTSGQENAGDQHGSNRHGTGLAADFRITDPLGNTLNVTNNRQAMMDVAQAIQAKGGLGIGLGSNYMGGKHIHADKVAPGPGQDNEWGNIGNAMRGRLADARNFALMPDSFYSRSLPAIGAPTPFGATQANPNSLARSTEDAPSFGSIQIGEDRAIHRSPIGLPSAPVVGPSQSLSPVAPSISIGPSPMQSTPVAPSAESFVSNPNVPGPVAPAAMPGPALAPNVTGTNLAAAYGQMASTLQQAGVNLAGQPLGMPALPAPNMPVALPPAPPVQQPPVQALPPPRVVRDMPVFSPPPAPPQFSPSDIYGGQVGTATASDGSVVGRDPFGMTTVTNKYGVTTAMTPHGKQSAYGGMPGPLGKTSLFGGLGMPGPSKGMVGAAAGGIAGSLVAGPVGGLIGAMIGKSMANGGFGNRGGFPSAPSAPSHSSAQAAADRARAHFGGGSGSGRGLSPSASRAIGSGFAGGFGGLY